MLEIASTVAVAAVLVALSAHCRGLFDDAEARPASITLVSVAGTCFTALAVIAAGMGAWTGALIAGVAVVCLAVAALPASPRASHAQESGTVAARWREAA